MTPIRIDAPAGTVVNPVLPAACGARGVIGYRVYDAIMGALAPLVPDRVLAAGEGGPTLIAWGGYDERRDAAVRDDGGARRHVGRAVDAGTGSRASRTRSRTSATSPSSCSRPTSRSGRALRRSCPDSGGAGRQRGGLAYVREYRVLARAGDADDPHRPPRPSALRARGRRAGCAVEQRRRLGRRRPRAADDADGGAARSSRATASPTSPPAAAASARPSSATPPPCSTTSSTGRCRSPPRASATAS